MADSTARRAAGPNAGRGRRDGDGQDKRRGTGRTSRGRRTRGRLLEGAKTVFERDGFLHARIADICDVAGISHGSFYTYFVSKEEIFKEIVDAVESDLLTLAPGSADADPVERIRAANEHYLLAYRDNAKIMRVIHQVATIDADVRTTRLQRQDSFARAIERRIRLFQASGVADPAVEPAYAAQALGGMVAYFAEYLFTTENTFNFDLTVATDQLTRIWTQAIGMRDTPNRTRSADT